MTYVSHLFMPQETIHAIIKKYNTTELSRSQLTEMMDWFNNENGLSVPRVGQRYKIPVNNSLTQHKE